MCYGCVGMHRIEIKFPYVFPSKNLVFETPSMSKKQRNKIGNIMRVLYSTVSCYVTRSYQIMDEMSNVS